MGKERSGIVQLQQYSLFTSSVDPRELFYIIKRPGNICSKK
jgi:hypothetical protein